jgi:hypothetical protein
MCSLRACGHVPDDDMYSAEETAVERGAHVATTSVKLSLTSLRADLLPATSTTAGAAAAVASTAAVVQSSSTLSGGIGGSSSAGCSGMNSMQTANVVGSLWREVLEVWQLHCNANIDNGNIDN